ncbi:exocyst complex component 8 [Acrasis kona]|uniref:Exocyst complex component 8 n=1 Tax=Acrasis kona TaxID=1008807 RepID=A0AAW2Z407_9EUKA
MFDRNKINERRSKKQKMRKFNPFRSEARANRKSIFNFKRNINSKDMIVDGSTDYLSSEEGTPKDIDEKEEKKKQKGITGLVKSALKTGAHAATSTSKVALGAINTGVSISNEIGSGVKNTTSAALNLGKDAIASAGSDQKMKADLINKIKNIQEETTEHLTTLKQVNLNINEVLKRDVYFHYPLFMRASKQIASIDSEMVELGQLFSEMKSSMITVDDCLSELTEVSKLRSNLFETTQHIRMRSESIDFQEGLSDIVTEFKAAVELHQIDKAVEMYRRGKQDHINGYQIKDQPNIEDELIEKFNHVVSSLVNELCIELSQHWKLNPLKTKKLATQLIQLDRHQEALDTFLNSQEDLIKSLITKKTEGQPIIFVESVSKLFFDLMCDIVDQFTDMFGNNYNSVLVKWVVRQLIQQYCQLIDSQVLEPYTESLSTVVKSCDTAFSYADKLGERGIVVTYLLRDHFRDRLKIALTTSLQNAKYNNLDRVQKEPWGHSKYTFIDIGSTQSDTIDMTDTGKKMHQYLNEFTQVIEPIVSVQVYQSTVRGLLQYVQTFYVCCYTIASTDHGRLNDSQFFSMISTVQFILHRVFPALLERLEAMFERDIPELTLFSEQTKGFDGRLIDLYCKTRSTQIIDQIGFHNPDRYPPKSFQSNNQSVSVQFQNLILFLSKLSVSLTEHKSFQNKEIVLPELMSQLVGKMNRDDGYWDRFENHSVTPSEVQNLVLDLFFLLESCRHIMFSDTRTGVNEMIERIGDYCKDLEDDGFIIKERDYYYKHIDQLSQTKSSIHAAINAFEDNFKNSSFDSIQLMINNSKK